MYLPQPSVLYPDVATRSNWNAIAQSRPRIIVVRVPRYRRNRVSEDECDYREDEENENEDSGNLHRNASDTAQTHESRDDRQNEKDDSIVEEIAREILEREPNRGSEQRAADECNDHEELSASVHTSL
jgi:TPP-dependent pyruvate/acetoin dehydrogenase alpha subunit